MAITYLSAADLLLDRLASHEDAEAGILQEYELAARTARDPGVRFLMQLIVQDEERHKGWMASLADSVREMESGGQTAAIPKFDDQADDAGLVTKTEQFIEAERRTLDDLKDLKRTVHWVAEGDRHLYQGAELAPSPATGRWTEDSPLPILLEAMLQDTKRHVDILQAIHSRLRHRRNHGNKQPR